METGASFPSYSGGAERLSERLFGRGPDAKKRFRSRVLRDVAWGPVVETGANVPSYSGGLATGVGPRSHTRNTTLRKFLEITRDYLDYFGNINILSN